MMRPVKLAGDKLLFGQGTLGYLAQLECKRMVIVLADDLMYHTGIMGLVTSYLDDAKIKYSVYVGVESNPKFSTVLKGAKFMLENKPDFILAIGGGSVMDAAKAMWVFYENPKLKRLEQLADKDNFPKLRKKALLGCIPTTAGTASEVSRSIVITDDKTNIKHGIGNMEMMPDLAICDPITTLSLPRSLTVITGYDALSHGLEALVSLRANYLSDLLAKAAIYDLYHTLPLVVNDLSNIDLRELMLNSAMVAGLAFTNVSLGIVHSISHSLGSFFDVAHGLLNSILMISVIKFNYQVPKAKEKYDLIAKQLGFDDIISALEALHLKLDLPRKLSELIKKEDLEEHLDKIVELSLLDGCTKTNPVIPIASDIKKIIWEAF